MRKTTILLAAQLLLATQEAPAASLHLTSTNDYRYIKFPTNGVVDIRGLGTGSEGLYRIPRREDMAFLTESLLERMDVSEALLHDAHEVIAPDYVSNPASYKRHYAAFPNYWQNPILSQEVFLDSGMFGTNDCRMVFPTNLNRSTWTLYDRPTDYTDSHNRTNLFIDGRYAVSRRLFDQFNRSHWTSSTLMGTSAMAFGYVTNAYHDICANTAPTFFQTTRSPATGYVRTIVEEYNPHELHSRYERDTGRWEVGNIMTDRTLVDTNASAFAKWSDLSNHYLKRRTFYKTSYSAFSNSIQPVSNQRTRYRYTRETRRDMTPNVTFPKFSNGSALNGCIAASAVVRFTHTVTEGTNTFYSLDKVLVMPTELRQNGSTQEGYPAYADNASISDYLDLCDQVIPDREFSENDIYAMFEYPDYPTSTYPITGTRTYSRSCIDEKKISVVCYVGLADVTFNARVLD